MCRILCLAICAVLLLAPNAWAGIVSVQWNANTEDDLAGYRLYYGIQSRGDAAYTETVEISDSAATSWSLELDAGTYYFGLTAFDAAGNESGMSTEVTAVIPAYEPPGQPGTPIYVP